MWFRSLLLVILGLSSQVIEFSYFIRTTKNDISLIPLCSPLQLAQNVRGSYTFEVRAISYSNSGHRDAAGLCCELSRTSSCTPWWCGWCECDNRFNFCLRPSGTAHDDNTGNCPWGSYSTGEVGDDSFNFDSSSIANGVSNPMVFTGSVWPVSTFQW